MERIVETLSTPITHECDVLVVGGGVAGIAAAMTDDFGTLSVAKLQKKLTDNGVKMFYQEL